MSSVAPPVTSNVSPPATAGGASARSSAADQLIDQRIDEARRAIWWSELTRQMLMIVIGAMAALLLWLIVDHWIYSPGPLIRAICLTSLIAVIGWFLVRRLWPVMTSRVTSEYAAWALEQDHPDYRQQLTSYVTLKDSASQRGIRARVVQVIGARAASLLHAHDALPGETMGTFRWWITAAALLAVLAAYGVASPKSSLASAKRLVAPLAAIDPAKRVQIRDVQPGDALALAGRETKVSARVEGLGKDEPVRLRWSGNGLAAETTLVLDPSTDRFTAALALDHSASGWIHYWIEAGDAVVGPFELSVENVPVVAIESVFYQPPEYTLQRPRTASSPAISAIDGTAIRIQAKTNRPVVKAELQFNPKPLGDSVQITGGRSAISIAEDGVTLTADLVLRGSRGRATAVELTSYQIRVWDANDQSNPDPIIYPIKVITDLPPEIAIVVPKQSPIEVPLNAQQTIEVHAMDADYQLQQVTLRVVRGIDTLSDAAIWVKPPEGSGKGNHVVEYRFRPIEHLLRPGDVVRVSATAIDNRVLNAEPSVLPNQTTTDEVEIRIIEDASDLPEDPIGNDGLSRPDDRPASDLESAESESGGQGSEGQGSEGQGSEGQGSEGQGSGESSGGDQSNQPNSETSNDSNPSDGGQGNGNKPSNDQPSDSNTAGNDQTGNDQTGNSPGSTSNESQAGKPADTAPMDDNSGDSAGSAESNPSDQPGSQSPTDAASQPASDSASPSATGDQSNQTPADPDQGTGKGTPQSPEHDGKAFERIKEYIEKQKQDPPQNTAPLDKDRDAASQDSAGQDSASQNDKNNDSATSQPPDRSNDGGAGASASPSESSANQSTDPAQGDGTGKMESGDAQPSPTASDAPSANDASQGTTADDGPKGDSATSPNDGRPESSASDSAGQNDSPANPLSSDSSKPNDSGKPSDSSKPNDSGRPNESDTKGSDSSDGTGSNSTPGNRPDSPVNDSNPSGPPSGGTGDQTGATDTVDSLDADPPPPPDLQYTKQATDMVLDYLEETRDKVDEGLLKELGWSQQDLQRFRERWEKVRELDQPTAPAESADTFEDALQSLGLEPASPITSGTSDSADALRDVRDSGNRRQAPASIRDAFDAFRRRK